MRVLFSPRLMLIALALPNAGCALRGVSETGAYEGVLPSLWPLLPISAITEMAAVNVFVANLILTFRQPPAHLRAEVMSSGQTGRAARTLSTNPATDTSQTVFRQDSARVGG